MHYDLFSLSLSLLKKIILTNLKRGSWGRFLSAVNRKDPGGTLKIPQQRRPQESTLGSSQHGPRRHPCALDLAIKRSFCMCRGAL